MVIITMVTTVGFTRHINAAIENLTINRLSQDLNAVNRQLIALSGEKATIYARKVMTRIRVQQQHRQLLQHQHHGMS